jgi:hypothetical protein
LIAFKYVYRSMIGLMAVFALFGLPFSLACTTNYRVNFGQIRDASGAAVPEASVVIRHRLPIATTV